MITASKEKPAVVLYAQRSHTLPNIYVKQLRYRHTPHSPANEQRKPADRKATARSEMTKIWERIVDALQIRQVQKNSGGYLEGNRLKFSVLVLLQSAARHPIFLSVSTVRKMIRRIAVQSCREQLHGRGIPHLSDYPNCKPIPNCH